MASWQDVATTQTGTIRAWWEGNYQDHGIGIVTGVLDDGTRYFVLDIDEHDPANSGSDTIAALEIDNGALPDTIRARTGSGGLHMLFRLADHHGDIGNGAGRLLGGGIDVRANNAQIVVAPTVHPNGNTYEWEQDHAIGEIEMAYAPDWLVDALTPPVQQSAQEQPIYTPKLEGVTDTRAGTRFNASTTWENLLTQDGWTPHHQEGDVYYWTRPNKDPREGVSASVNHNSNDALTVFTTSITNLPVGQYDRFGYWTQTRHGGDFKDAARTLNAQQDDEIGDWIDAIQKANTPTFDIITQGDDPDPLSMWYVNWQQLWSLEVQETDWLLEPILARGRAHALYAGAKSGKSLLLLEMAAALATGRSIFGQDIREPMPVMYLDYEMTASDVRSRLEAFGYSENDDLTNLHYVLLPSISGLDTPEGAKVIITAIQAKKIQLVIIDTTARAVEGEENDADTLRAFYRWSGVNMKSLGVTWIRADHAGKNAEKGQRGSSAKNDDVDVVWKFTKRTLTNILIQATHKRMQWIPDTVEMELREIEGALTHHIMVDEISDAVTDLAGQLDLFDAPVDITNKAARALLKENDVAVANDILSGAIKLRKARTGGSLINKWLDGLEVDEQIDPKPDEGEEGPPQERLPYSDK